MSKLGKSIDLLQPVPENKLETATVSRKSASSIVGIAHQYATPELIPLEEEAFANAMAENFE